MKKITLLIVCLVGFVSFAQVNISENFDSGTPAGWTDSYSNSGELSCSGSSERVNLYSSNASANLTSANEVSASNFTDLNVSFDYKIVDYDNGTFGASDNPTPPGWGTAELQYSLDDGTTWTTILTIDDSNHTASASCAAVMATVPAASLPSGSDVKLQIINTWAAGDYFFYVDNFVAQQELGCVSPIGTAAFASEDCLAGTFNVDFDITDLGDGSPVLFDGTTSTPIAAIGMFTLSYPIGTAVSFTLQHGSSAVCDVDLGTVSDTGLCPVFATVDCSAGTPVNTTFCYDSNEDLRYVFTSTDGSALRVDFIEGYFEDCCDDITIYDGGEITDTVLFASDTNFNNDATGISAVSTGDTVMVRMVSDSSASCAAGSGSGISLSFDVSCSACTPPAATAVFASEDCAAGTFNIDFDITDLGDGSPVLFDGTTSTPIAAVGMFTLTYPIGTPVSFVLQHGSSSLCDVDLGTISDTGLCPVFATVDCSAGTPVNTTFCYDSNEDLRYVFTSTDGSALRVDFIEGYFEDCCDDITIYDGGEITDAVLFASDTNFNNDATGISAISTGDTVMVRMVSDGSVSCAAGSGSGIPLNFNVSCNTCTSSTSTAAVIDDCTNSSGFTVVIDITDMGSATDLTLSDDQGSATQSATAIGMFTFGPYASGTVVEIAVANDADALCTETFSDLTFNCPPVNNDCFGAISLTPGAVFTENPIVGSNAGATGSGETPLPSCSSYDPADTTGFGGDVWYSVVVPADGNLTIETDNNGGPSTDSGMQVYSGTCGSLVAVGCDDDGGNGAFSQVVIESADGLAGETLLVRVFEYGGNSEMNFLISAFSATLSTTDLENQAAFTYFPNPVKNTLTLNAQNTIENVVMYNMLGQQVLRVMPNTIDSELDMSNLQTGTYFVKVTIANVTKTIRVIKQ